MSRAPIGPLMSQCYLLCMSTKRYLSLSVWRPARWFILWISISTLKASFELRDANWLRLRTSNIRTLSLQRSNAAAEWCHSRHDDDEHYYLSVIDEWAISWSVPSPPTIYKSTPSHSSCQVTRYCYIAYRCDVPRGYLMAKPHYINKNEK